MRRVGLLAATLIGAAAAGVGCGGGSGGPGGGTGLVSCTVSESVGGDGGISLMVCEEVSGSAQAAQMLQQGCVSPAGGLPDAGITAGAHFANGPCSHVGALGACQLISMGATVNAWYYDDGSGLQTSATVQALCSQVGATFIPP